MSSQRSGELTATDLRRRAAVESYRALVAEALGGLIDLTGHSVRLVITDETQAMRQDWQVAGDDLRHAMSDTEESVKIKNQDPELVEA